MNADSSKKKQLIKNKIVGGTVLSLHLLDGSTTGRVKCTQKNWTGIGYKIPRSKIPLCKNMEDFNTFGIYFLIGDVIKDSSNKKDRKLNAEDMGKLGVYVGKAGLREQGNILTRMEEHKNDDVSKRLDWDTFVIFVTANNCLGPTELSYLEYKLWERALNNKRCTLRNNSAPDVGYPTDEVIADMSEFIEHVSLALDVLGYDILRKPVEYNPPVNEMRLDLSELHNKDKTVFGYLTDGGFIIKKGSVVLSPNHPNPSCSTSGKDFRAKYAAEYIDNETGTIKKHLFLPNGTYTSSADFMTGSHVSGPSSFWFTSNDMSLSEYLSLLELR